MFQRLLAKWHEAEPGTNDWALVRRSLDSVHGCDKNPFAVAIARFRLLVAVLKAGEPAEDRDEQVAHTLVRPDAAVKENVAHAR